VIILTFFRYISSVANFQSEVFAGFECAFCYFNGFICVTLIIGLLRLFYGTSWDTGNLSHKGEVMVNCYYYLTFSKSSMHGCYDLLLATITL